MHASSSIHPLIHPLPLPIAYFVQQPIHTCLLIHPPIHPFFHSSTHPFNFFPLLLSSKNPSMHVLNYSSIHPPIHPLYLSIGSFVNQPIHTCFLIYPSIHSSFIHSSTPYPFHPPIHAPIHPLIHPSTHPIFPLLLSPSINHPCTSIHSFFIHIHPSYHPPIHACPH